MNELVDYEITMTRMMISDKIRNSGRGRREHKQRRCKKSGSLPIYRLRKELVVMDHAYESILDDEGQYMRYLDEYMRYLNSCD